MKDSNRTTIAYIAGRLINDTNINLSHEGNKPVSFVWKLKNAIPGKFISETNKNVL